MRVRSGGLVLSVMIIGFLLIVSCSATPSTSPTTSGTSGTSQKPTEPYGEVTIAGNFGQDILDPHGEMGRTFLGIGNASIDALITLNPDGKPVPGLAERWEIAPDGMTHTFYIRKGVKFHDGSDLTGADVKFSLERAMAPGTLITQGPIWARSVASVDLKDSYTVALRMKTPQYDLLVDSHRGVTAVLPKKYIEEKGIDYWTKNPVGSGPFKVLSYQPGARLELQALDSHWRTVPHFRKLTVLNVPEEATRIAMLKTGELDMARVSPDSVAGLKSAGIQILSWAGGGQYIGYVFYDVDNPEKFAIGDRRVRKGLVMALDRKEMANTLYGGNSRPTFMYPVAPTAPFLESSVLSSAGMDPRDPLKMDPYNPDGAKKLLAEAGYPNGFNTRIYDTTGVGVNTLNQAIAGYWWKVGVKADLIPVDYTSWFPKMMPKMSPEIWNSLWTYPTTWSFDFAAVTRTYDSKTGVPKNHKNAKLDELLQKAPSTADPAERKRLMTEAVVLARNEYLSLPLVDTNAIMAVGPKVGGMLTPSWAWDIDSILFETIAHPK